jgi:hypothetical protein
MLRTLSTLKGCAIRASDGEIGRIEDVYFDDEAWTIRYLVADTGTWLSRREVLISPRSVKQPPDGHGAVEVSLTREQVRLSPDIDTHKPVSRQLEREYLGYYGYPTYWATGGMWAAGADPGAPPASRPDYTERHETRAPEVSPEDVHLRSSRTVLGYHVQASDDTFGHIEDFIFDTDSWVLRYAVVDTRNWWPASKKVLIATQWFDDIDWSERRVHTTLTRQAIETSAEYDPSRAIDRKAEVRLHELHRRTGYWD